MFSIYPLPESSTIISSIERLRDFIIGNCKECQGTGFSGYYTNNIGLKTKLPCNSCSKPYSSISSMILCGIPSSFAVVCKEFHESLHNDDKNMLEFILNMFKKEPTKSFSICLSSDYKGVGKTGSVIVLARKMIEHIYSLQPALDSLPLTFCSVSHLSKKIFSSISEKSDSNQAFLDSIFMNHILILDGLGDHYAKTGISGDEQFLTNKLEELIRYRQGAGLITIATSNYNLFYRRSNGDIMADPEGKPPSIMTKYGERFAGLWIGGNCKWYDWKTDYGIREISNKIEWPV